MQLPRWRSAADWTVYDTSAEIACALCVDYPRYAASPLAQCRRLDSLRYICGDCLRAVRGLSALCSFHAGAVPQTGQPTVHLRRLLAAARGLSALASFPAGAVPQDWTVYGTSAEIACALCVDYPR
jgi:hypothetical protein